MRTLAILLALSAGPALAEGPLEATGELGKRTTVGALHESGYVVGQLATTPATDAAAIRMTFTMEHGTNRLRPLYMCRMFIGPGDTEVEPLMIRINACERID